LSENEELEILIDMELPSETSDEMSCHGRLDFIFSISILDLHNLLE